MKKIFVRSPYFVEVDELAQSSVRLEIKLWHKGQSIPSLPRYIITEKVPSASQNKISINVSNYAKDFIKPISPTVVTSPTEENTNTWCFMQVVSYSNDVEINDETFVCLNGYSNYMGGYNQGTTDDIVPLVNNDIKMYMHNSIPYINVFFKNGLIGILWHDENDNSFDFNTTDFSLFKLPIISNSNWRLDYSPYLFNFKVEQLCEPKYTPITCTFINRYGGWQFLTFFKANTQSIEVKSKDFKMMPNAVAYNPLQGQTKRFNFQGTKKIKCNTGWVDENYSELIQDLLLSEVVLLDNKPAIVKSQNFDIKTHLKDKNINYEIEFEYNYGLINDVI